MSTPGAGQGSFVLEVDSSLHVEVEFQPEDIRSKETREVAAHGSLGVGGRSGWAGAEGKNGRELLDLKYLSIS